MSTVFKHREPQVRDSTTLPFVSFKLQPTEQISSTPQLIFGSQVTCILDGLIIANQCDDRLLFSLYLLREDQSPTPTGATQYMLVSNKPLEAQDSVDLLESKTLFLEAGDTLYAYSDYNSNVFNTFVSYRQLNETLPSFIK